MHSDKFLAYMCSQVLPHLSEVSSSQPAEEKTENGAAAAAAAEKTPDDTQLEVLKLLAEMSAYCGPMEGKLRPNLEKVFTKLLVGHTGWVN